MTQYPLRKMLKWLSLQSGRTEGYPDHVLDKLQRQWLQFLRNEHSNLYVAGASHAQPSLLASDQHSLPPSYVSIYYAQIYFQAMEIPVSYSANDERERRKSNDRSRVDTPFSHVSYFGHNAPFQNVLQIIIVSNSFFQLLRGTKITQFL